MAEIDRGTAERRRGYKPNHSMEDGLGGFMMDPRKTGAIAIKAARTVAQRAKMLVEADAGRTPQPRTAGGQFAPHKTTPLANNFKVHETVVVLNENPPNPRRAAIVVNDSRHAAAWEFGTNGHQGAHRSLRRAAQSVGEWRGVQT